MSQKVIYVKIADRLECIEFNANTSSDDLKGKYSTKQYFYNNNDLCISQINY